MRDFASFYILVTMATSAAYLTLACIVARFHKPRAYTRLWIGVCALLALLWLGMGLVNRVIQDHDIALIVLRLTLTAGACLATCYLWFALAFLGLLERLRAVALLSVASAAILIALFWASDLVVTGIEKTPYGINVPVAGPLMPLHGLFTAVNGFAPVVLFALRFRKATGRTRLQLGYMLVAIAIMAVGAVGSLLPIVARNSVLATLPSLFMILSPSLVTYAIIRHQLWDIRTVIHRTVMWVAASLVVVVPVYLFLQLYAAHIAARRPAVVVVAAVLLLGAFTLHFRVVQPWLDDRFARRKHDQNRVVDRFNREVVHLKGVKDLAELVTATVQRTVYATAVQVHAASTERGEASRRRNPCDKLDKPAREWLIAHDSAVDLTLLDGYRTCDEQARAELEATFGASHAAVVLPLVHEGLLIGLVTLGEKQNLQAYTRDDFQLLERIRPAATVAFANAQLYDQLQELTESLENRVEQRTAELRDANERLLELDRQKSKFFANITHELRTPLTLILGPLEDLLIKFRDSVGMAGAAEDLGVMHRNALRLLRQINALLDLAKHDAGRLRLKAESLRLGELVEAAVRNFRPIARRKGVSLALEPLPPGASDAMAGDAEKLTLVMNNLLANALKFTPSEGKVQVTVRGDEQFLSVEVSDTGIGIPDDQLERIFDRFAQVESGATRRFEGAGIGLALVKELVGLHQGSVHVKSEEGQGSSFRIELPRELVPVPEQVDRRKVDLPTGLQRRAEDRDPVAWVAPSMDGDAWISVAAPESSERGPASAKRHQRLVIAEDNPDMRAYLERRLGELFEVTACADGQEALEACRQRPPDLLLADIMMPGLSGLDLCQELRAEESTAAIPIVLLTARKGLERTLEGFEVGADDYLTKPFNFRELLARIRVQLKLAELGRELARHQKGEAFNLVAAGLAHEVRNPVNAILNAVRPLLEGDHPSSTEPEDREAREELLKAILESGERIDRLCADLLDVSRPHLDEVSDWKIDEALDAALRLIRYKNDGLLPQVVTHFGHDLPVFGRTPQLNQVLMNVLDNAVRAAGPDGCVTVRTQQQDATFRLRVQDSGPGIPAKHVDRLFDPLFSTYAVHGAKGLGLHIARRIVEEHGGSIRASNAQGGGAEFVIELPLQMPECAATDRQEAS